MARILCFTIATFSLLISLTYLHPNFIKTSHKNLSNPSHLCYGASKPTDCQNFVSEILSDGVKSYDDTILLQKFLMKQVHLMKNALFKVKYQTNARIEKGSLSDCLELFDRSVDLVHDSIKALSTSSHFEAQTWLSGVLTNHDTCLDGLNNKNSTSKGSIDMFLDDLISRASASLAILAAISSKSSPDIQMVTDNTYALPSWIRPSDRKLMQESGNAITADLTVAKDGSGNYKTVKEAIAASPDKGSKRFVIYVKKGTYKENVEVGKNKRNLMIVGDGMDSTVLTGDLNVVDGSTTFNSATLAAVGESFILQDICIQNTAGPEKHQAVALRVGADKSVINRCKLDAYQDTLYTHSLRQFYRDSYITGTVDFIFGNAAVVFQKCTLVARKPMAGQQNMFTAQGRTDPNQNTGTSIQNCEIKASDDLQPVKSSFKTYLGRPWKEYSRTVVMQSVIGDIVDPAGWAAWSGDFALSTLYYGEYKNTGLGSGTGKRVNWAGFHVITDSAEASKFTVKELIQGAEWLGLSGVAYSEGL